MTSVDAIEREITRQRRRLRKIEDTQGAELRRAYLMIYRRLRDQLGELQKAIKLAKAQGVDIKTSWLVDQWQYKTLIQDLEREVWAFSRQVNEIVGNGQRQALSNVHPDQQRLFELASGAPPALQAQVGARFISLSPQAVEAFVGFAGDGKPLGDLIAKIAPKTAQAAKDTITYGIARGQSPRVIATQFRKVASVPLDRALTISRTEVLRAYNSAAMQTYQANADVMQGWRWIASLDDRTCPACAAMNGTLHGMSEMLFENHVNCRCTSEPVTKSWKELGFSDMDQFEPPVRPSPEDMFDALPVATQRSILGPGRYDLYSSGQIGMDDFVKVTRSEVWGNSHVVKPLKDLTQ